RYARQPADLARHCATNTALTQRDATVMAMTVAYGCVLGSLVRGEPLDAATSDRLMALVRDGALPFHSVTSAGENTPPPGPEAPRTAGQFASPDRSEEHTSELQSRENLVCRLLLEKNNHPAC